MPKNAELHEIRPWGQFWIIGYHATKDNESVEKRIQVLPNQRLSLQSHDLRSEKWFIESGHGTVTLDNEIRKVYAGDSIEIAIGVIHRIKNDSDEIALVFFERTYGKFDEHDITRYEDDYDRDSSWKNS